MPTKTKTKSTSSKGPKETKTGGTGAVRRPRPPRATPHATAKAGSAVVEPEASAAEEEDLPDDLPEGPPEDLEADDGEGGSDEPAPAPRRAPAGASVSNGAKAPRAVAAARGRGAAGDEQRDAVPSPVRRLTPAAKKAINDLVAKGVPLAEAIRRAASWEAVVVEHPPVAAVAGPGAGASPFSMNERPRRAIDDEEEPIVHEDEGGSDSDE